MMQTTVRQKLLAFDGIEQPEQKKKKPQRMGDIAKALQRQRLNYRRDVNNQLRLLAKVKDPSFQINQTPKTKLQLFLDKIDTQYQILRPQSIFVFCWNIFMLIAILANFFEIPIALFMTSQVYEDQFNTSVPLAINIIFLIGFFIDMFIRFNLSYYKLGKLVDSRAKIFDKYIKFKFWIDLVTTIVLLVYISGGDPNLIYLKLVFYLKIISLSSIDREILQYLIVYRISKGLYKLFRIVILIWFITIWVSSVYFAMDYYWYRQNGFYRQTGQIWLTNSNAVGNINLIQKFPQWYIWLEYAVYWSLQTSSTVGYGNMTPRNPNQVLYCNFVIVLNTVLFAFYINSIWQIIGEMQQASERYAQNWSNLKQIIHSQQLPAKTSDKISDYFHEIWIDEDKEEIQEKMYQMLSEDLRTQLFFTTKSKFYNKIQLFKEICDFSPLSQFFMKKLVYEIGKGSMPYGESIYYPGDDTQQLYYLLRGKVELRAPKINASRIVVIGQNFGIQQFILEGHRLIEAKAASFSTFYKLSISKFKEILKQFPALYEYYCQLKENIIIEQQYFKINTQCIYCKADNHILPYCKTLNIWRKVLRQPIQVLKAYNPGTPSLRIPYQRRTMKPQKFRIPLYKKLETDQIQNFIGYWKNFNVK